MREIDVGEIIKAVEELCIKANKILPDDLCGCISCAEKSETDELPKKIMGTLLENLDAAKELNLPICQDTGMAVIFCDVGQDVHIVGGDFENPELHERLAAAVKQIDERREDADQDEGL